MSATQIVLIAIAAGVVGRWANNQQAVPPAAQTVSVVFAVIFIAALDQGRTAGIAHGLAWLILAAVLLSNNSPLTGLSKLSAKSTTTTTAK